MWLQLLARNSVSRQPCVLALDGLPVLLAFADGRTPADALVRLRTKWKIDEDGFATVVSALVTQNLLTPAAGGGAESSLATGGFASPLSHFMMVRDSVRVMSYRRAIQRHCQGRTVVEIGCGSGILSNGTCLVGGNAGSSGGPAGSGLTETQGVWESFSYLSRSVS